MSSEFWDARYGAEGFAYGEEPNDFLREVADRLPRGPALCLGAGEGRNAVYLAGLDGMGPVAAIDQSAAGLAKAAALARKRGLELRTIVGDLAQVPFGEGWSVITAIWAHVPPRVRARVHAEVQTSLAPGGVFVLESYTPAQVGRGTGGPPDRALTTDLEELRAQLPLLDIEIGRELDRQVNEGAFHDGVSAVVQLLAVKPTS